MQVNPEFIMKREIDMSYTYHGTHITGKGNADYLKLIDQSFAMLHATPDLPSLQMLYNPDMGGEKDMLTEGFIWGGGWWIQNSYGFTLGAIPLVDELWQKRLQNAYDAFWNRIGDGKRSGIVDEPEDKIFIPFKPLIAPDGCLGDAVVKDGLVYKQGDGDFNRYDWFYEATAAGVNMEADILLFNRDPETIRKYLPIMKRSLDFIERTRAENGLFLVGMCCNLLAPSFGACFNEETGEFGKAYLTGLAITYSAGLMKNIELAKMVGEDDLAADYQARLDKTKAALPQLLTDEGYFVKSMDPDGTMHGVYGQEKYGYLEGVCNVDAVAHRIVDDVIANSILDKIASVEGIRPAGVLCNNYPHLDDTYRSYELGTSGPDTLQIKSGDWVDGGCWATVEGRALLSYLRMGRYEDAYKAAAWYMRWNEEYRQDAPFTQWGLNTNNWWAQENDDYSVCKRPVAVMVDNFAAATCLLRGLFGYVSTAEGLMVETNVPAGIEEYHQHNPIYWGGCKVYISYFAGDKGIRATVNGKEVKANGKSVFLTENDLPRGGEVHLVIDCTGEGKTAVLVKREDVITGDTEGVPADVKAIYDECAEQLKTEKDPIRRMRLKEILLMTEAGAKRRKLPFDKFSLRPTTEDRIQGVINVYDGTVKKLYRGVNF